MTASGQFGQTGFGPTGFADQGAQTLARKDRWLKTNQGFSAEFFMTDEPISARLHPDDVLKTRHITTTKRTSPVHVALFFANPGPSHTIDHKGKEFVFADVRYDLLITRPDGGEYFHQKDIRAWSDTMPAQHLLHVSRSIVTISFESIDPKGTYTVEMVVHDKSRDISIPLRHTITLE